MGRKHYKEMRNVCCWRTLSNGDHHHDPHTLRASPTRPPCPASSSHPSGRLLSKTQHVEFCRGAPARHRTQLSSGRTEVKTQVFLLSNLILSFRSASQIHSMSSKYAQIRKTMLFALAGEAQWIEHQPVNQRVASSIPSQGICLGCRPGPQQGACGRQPHIDVSFPLFLPPFPSLKINK